MATLVSQYAYARHRGISKQAVSKAVREGRIRLTDGKVPLEEADQLAIWGQPREQGKSKKAVRSRVKPPSRNGHDDEPPEQEGGSLSLARARMVRESWRARRERLEYERKAGILVSAADMRIVAFEKARQARELLLRLPDRLAPVLAGRSEVDCHELLTRELQAICEQLAKKE